MVKKYWVIDTMLDDEYSIEEMGNDG